MATVAKKLEHAALKGLVVGATGAVASVLVGNGFKLIPLFHHDLPKYVVVGGSLFMTSVATDFLIPYITPWESMGNQTLQNFENIFLGPALCGVGMVLLDSIIAPEAIKDFNSPAGKPDFGMLAGISTGFGASVLAGYTAQGLGWIPTVGAQ